MNHVAIDLGGKESQICIRQPDGTIVEERKVPTRKLVDAGGLPFVTYAEMQPGPRRAAVALASGQSRCVKST